MTAIIELQSYSPKFLKGREDESPWRLVLLKQPRVNSCMLLLAVNREDIYAKE